MPGRLPLGRGLRPPVKPGGILIRAKQRLVCAHVDRNTGAAQFHREQRIASGPLNLDVACHRGDGNDADIGGAQRHDERHGIVGSCVGINQERAGHARSIAKQELSALVWQQLGKDYADIDDWWGTDFLIFCDC